MYILLKNKIPTWLCILSCKTQPSTHQPAPPDDLTPHLGSHLLGDNSRSRLRPRNPIHIHLHWILHLPLKKLIQRLSSNPPQLVDSLLIVYNMKTMEL